MGTKSRCIWIGERLRIAEMPLSLGQYLVWLSSGSCYPSATSALSLSLCKLSLLFECVRSPKAGKAIYTYHINQSLFWFFSRISRMMCIGRFFLSVLGLCILPMLNSCLASYMWPGSIRRVRANLRQSRSRTTALGQRFFLQSMTWFDKIWQQQQTPWHTSWHVISFWLNSTALVWVFCTLQAVSNPDSYTNRPAKCRSVHNSLVWTLALPWISLAQSRTSRRVSLETWPADVW